MSTPLSKRYYGAHPIKHFCSGNFAGRKEKTGDYSGSALSVDAGTGLPAGPFFAPGLMVVTSAAG